MDAERDRVAGMIRAAEVPKAASLSSVLVQALQSNDTAQLELCLSVNDDKVIEETVARLPAPKVVSFLTKVIAKLEAKPSRGQGLAKWIRAVLVQHTAHLMSVPGLVSKLSGLHQMIEARLSVFDRLCRLSGRLDIVLSQLTQHTSRTKAVLGKGPKVVSAEDVVDGEAGLSDSDSEGSGQGSEDDEDDEGGSGDDDSIGSEFDDLL